MSNNDSLDTPGAAAHIGVPESTLRFWRSSGKPDAPISYRVGRRIRYRVSDLDAWLQEQYKQTATR